MILRNKLTFEVSFLLFLKKSNILCHNFIKRQEENNPR